jgi:hypothetical protein
MRRLEPFREGAARLSAQMLKVMELYLMSTMSGLSQKKLEHQARCLVLESTAERRRF